MEETRTAKSAIRATCSCVAKVAAVGAVGVGIAGELIGGTTGTLALPGGGTIAGGAVGAEEGTFAGAPAGAALGSILCSKGSGGGGSGGGGGGAQDKKLTPGEIQKLKNNNINPEELKEAIFGGWRRLPPLEVCDLPKGASSTKVPQTLRESHFEG